MLSVVFGAHQPQPTGASARLVSRIIEWKRACASARCPRCTSVDYAQPAAALSAGARPADQHGSASEDPPMAAARPRRSVGRSPSQHHSGRCALSATVTQQTPARGRTGPPLIALEGVRKVYRTGKMEFPALRGIDMTVCDGDMVAIVGPSGSGKSTIMNMITGIDRPTAGTVTVRGERIDLMSEEQLAVWRGRHVGVVFQFFQLLPTLTALENATLPLDFARRGSKRERRERALHNLELVGLADMPDRLPSEMSGGQQQRVAIARALASYPTLVIGDEPTGNLDTRTAAEMFELLQRVCDEGATVLYVTHDLGLAARANRTI